MRLAALDDTRRKPHGIRFKAALVRSGQGPQALREDGRQDLWKSPEMEEKVSALLFDIREALDALGLDFTEEDMKSLIRLEKPVIMVSRRR